MTTESVLRNEERQFGRESVLSVDNVNGFSPSDRLLGRDLSRYKLVRAGQFAYNPMRLNVGSIALREDGHVGIVSPDYIVFSCNEKVLNPQFLEFFRCSAAWRSQITQSGQGSVRIRYYYRHIAEFLVPLPPLAEQRGIAMVLRTVERAKEACEKVIAATRQLKQSLLHHLFTYGPVSFDQADKVVLKQTDFGSAPASWPIQPLGDCAYVQTGVAKGRSLNGGEVIELPYLRVANVQDGRLDLSEMKSIQLRKREVSRFCLRPGDVVLTEGGDFDKSGRGFVWKSEVSPCVHQNHIFAVRVDRKQLLPEFLAYEAQSSYGKCYFLTVAHKTANLACINTTKLKAWPILVPPIEDQQEIAANFSAVDAKLASEEKRRAALDALFRSLLHQLMTGQVRVADLGDEYKADGSMSPSEPGVGLAVEAAP